MKYCYIDFEFNGLQENKLNLVCGSLKYLGETRSYWLFNDPIEQKRLKDFILSIRDDCTFVAFHVSAEARSFIALGINPTKCKWVDIKTEFMMSCNSNHKMNYGDIITADYKKKKTTPPRSRWDRYDGYENEEHQETGKNLVACVYKCLGKYVDSDRKTKMRDIIIRGDIKEIEDHRKEIIEYCESDIVHLDDLLGYFMDFLVNRWKGRNHLILKIPEEMQTRGEYGARTALMETLGYGIHYDWIRNLSDNIIHIMNDVCEEINSNFDDPPMFIWNKRRGQYSKNLKNIRHYLNIWLGENPKVKWPKTDTEALSLSIKAFQKHFNYKDNYPDDFSLAQYMKFIYFEMNLKGFTGGTGKTRKFWDYVGSDKRVRADFNIYRAQTSRSQPKANGFIFLKSKWVRCLVAPAPGKCICGIDYGSQEFLVSALLSNDDAMIEAYESGDPYLAFGKQAGMIPPEGTKKTHKVERDLCKATTLGVSYGMSKYGLANDLTQKGIKTSEDEAQELIDSFYEVFNKFADYKEQTLEDYSSNGYIRLQDGWTMWGDNDNERSVGNFPMQGYGAVAMRKAVALAQDAGLDVIMTLHDALYIEFDQGDWEAIDCLRDCMREAFCYYFSSTVKEKANLIRLDADLWGSGMTKDQRVVTPKGQTITAKKIYRDERGETELNKFKKYFMPIKAK